ncbi:MAG: hypothetical protein J7K62_01960 [Thermoplasmata archaeon]|nr:hypothetical protein [Thermoplasmata archaeon]
MLTKIKFRRVWNNWYGGKALEICDITGVYTKSELPKEYLKSVPRYYRDDTGIVLVFDRVRNGGYEYFHFKVGDLFRPKVFGRWIGEMKKAGETLTRINKEMEQEKAKWEDSKVHEVTI